jgi:hypothetical protein
LHLGVFRGDDFDLLGEDEIFGAGLGDFGAEAGDLFLELGEIAEGGGEFFLGALAEEAARWVWSWA